MSALLDTGQIARMLNLKDPADLIAREMIQRIAGATMNEAPCDHVRVDVGSAVVPGGWMCTRCGKTGGPP